MKGGLVTDETQPALRSRAEYFSRGVRIELKSEHIEREANRRREQPEQTELIGLEKLGQEEDEGELAGQRQTPQGDVGQAR
jgi:hypothetical protein